MQKLMVLICLGVFTLTGCSSPPRQVKASVPLVQNQVSAIGDKIPTQYRSQLENSVTQAISHPKYQIEVGSFYTSSLGQECRALLIAPSESDEQVSRVACTEPKQYPDQIRVWYLIPNIVQSSSIIQL